MPLALGAPSAAAQTVDDGLMMPNGVSSTGVLYTHDSRDEYGKERSNVSRARMALNSSARACQERT